MRGRSGTFPFHLHPYLGACGGSRTPGRITASRPCRSRSHGWKGCILILRRPEIHPRGDRLSGAFEQNYAFESRAEVESLTQRLDSAFSPIHENLPSLGDDERWDHRADRESADDFCLLDFERHSFIIDLMKNARGWDIAHGFVEICRDR